MLNIESILNIVYHGIKAKDPRFEVLDDEHIKDTKTSTEFHLYDSTSGSKIKYGEKVVTKMEYFRLPEQEILFEIKKLITDPKKVAQKVAHYPIMVKEAREAFADLFENPNPIIEKGPIAEENTTEYHG